MKISKKINAYRKIIMRFFTKNIGISKNTSQNVIVDPTEIKKVLICRPNARLGNLLLVTPLIKEVGKYFPNAEIDLFVKGGLMNVILENYPKIGQIIILPKKPFKNLYAYIKVWFTIKHKKYDMVINVDNESSSGRLAVDHSHAEFKFYGDAGNEDESKPDDYEHIAKYPVYNFREFLKSAGVKVSTEAIMPIDLKLNSTEIEKGSKILRGKFENNKKTIALFTYATGEKCYSESWWIDFYELLKSKYERDFNILEILPIENVSKIGFKATSFYSKDIREIGAVIANTAIFIGADSGIMHLASAVHIPVIGLFSISKLKKYEPYGERSMGIDTNANVNKNCYILEIDRILQG
ncbi:MAG: glycosyltransferase family 9 protein [Flavobacterium sp.]|uniref:glycosyltransferase family 9 protein n=1 Tax=Flavobacterium sp. TaxID=239 RepID=UPI001B0C79F6|nr:glycosyltransferase family 9 protein [Flavobacterium sp.]MBO9584780.1 glycosyltransferase family 9 protein [Flavobacterium sp.]